MNVDILSWLINGITFGLLISPLFLVLESNIIVFVFITCPIFLWICYIYFSLPRSKSQYNQFENQSIAHRGGHPVTWSNEIDQFPENTLAAFRWASTREEADGIELDVWLSKDNIPMINHDEYLGRTFADCHQYISSLTCAELKKQRYLKRDKQNVYPIENQEAMPTLEEVILFIQTTKLKIMIEVKERKKIPEMAQIIDNLFQRYPFLYERAYCAAFHPYNIYAIRKINPYITTGFLYAANITSHIISNTENTPKPMPVYLRKNFIIRTIIDKLFDWFHSPAGLRFLGADILCIQQGELSQNFLNQCRKSNIVVCAWTVNQLTDKQWFKANRVTVITDILI